jgi:hypothetical protein
MSMVASMLLVCHGRFPLSSVEGLTPAATTAQVGMDARELARGNFAPGHRRPERERAGAPPLGTDTATSIGSGELRPWHRHRCDRGGAPPPATATTARGELASTATAVVSESANMRELRPLAPTPPRA